jgi:glycosyltransferase involved in cell wall biosynthesis
MNEMTFGTAVSRQSHRIPRHIALIGNSLPRKCGLATFTSDCFDALRARFPDTRIDFYAMDDGASVAYPHDVTLIAQDDPIAYAEAARRIEESGAEAIWLQHEYGIFGGSAGEMILRLLARTRLPLLTTLHTVLKSPNADERRVMEELLARSAQVLVMARQATQILKDVYGLDESRVTFIPHGVPDRAYVEPAEMRGRVGFEGRRLILTFGLLAPDKGIEYMVRAMPAVAARHPEALYLVLGATHPNLLRDQGDGLREGLKALAAELGVTDNVAFIDCFVEQEALLDYLQAADVYVTPYVNAAQSTSGTLSYAVAMGRPVVSTPYVHAAELLDEGRGLLVPFRDSEALAEAVCDILEDDALRRTYADLAYARGREMLWSELAARVGDLLCRAGEGQPAIFAARRRATVLEPNLAAIIRMSDGTGMLQHSILSVPDRNHGYCIDDNARALMLMSQIDPLDEELRDQWTSTYAAFVQYAWNADRGRFRNFMAYDRSWCEDEGSEDSSGRTLWALGVTARDARMAKHRQWASAMFDRCIGPLGALASPRAQAFAVLGADAMLDVAPDHNAARDLIARFSGLLSLLVEETRRPDWAWFETILAYDNARLPEALLRAGKRLDDADMIRTGLSTLDWINMQQTAPEGHFRPVGTESFGRPFARPLPFDQQPLEAQATIEACAAAFDVDPDLKWIARAENAYDWYLGGNDLALPLATRADGGCFDGLTPYGVNRNQGAESLLALQLSSCAMNRLSKRAGNVASTTSGGEQKIPA